MAPTIKQGDSVIADILYYKSSSVQRGDVVIVKDPDGRRSAKGEIEMYVKRVVGLGGDKVQIKNAKVYVNDQVMSGVLGSAKYETDFPVEDFGPVTVLPGQYFLLGDNLPNSADSRQWEHSVTLGSFYGKVTMVKAASTGKIRSL
jgi:signal peptidase I